MKNGFTLQLKSSAIIYPLIAYTNQKKVKNFKNNRALFQKNFAAAPTGAATARLILFSGI
jgi:hypothetical protein